MEIIGAAALIAVGIVLAALVYGRMHGTKAASVPANRATESVDVELPARTAELARREAELARREAELARRDAEMEREREALSGSKQQLERELERISGLSAARAKQILLQE